MGAPQQEMKLAREQGRAADERWHQRKDGSLFYMSGVMSPIYNNGLTGYVKVARDMTEQKQAAEWLRLSEERYRIAMEAGELATWDWNLITNKITWNEQHFKLFGIENKGQMIDPDFFLKFVFSEDLPAVKEQLSAVTGDKGIYKAEFRVKRPNDHELYWMSGYGRVTESKNGKPSRVSGVMFDCTERRHAQEELQSAQNSLNTALEAAKMGVWDINFTTGQVTHSRRHDQLLGYSDIQEPWSSEMAKEHMMDADKLKFDEAFENMLQTGKFDMEARIIHSNNAEHLHWVHYFGRLFRDAKGEATHAAGVIVDITDRKTAEKQKDEFLGIASHELKTPVTTIKAYAEILQEMFTDAHDMKSANLMSKMDKQIDRLTKLIKDLLDVTKVSEGQLHLTRETINLEELIKNITEEMQRTTRQHQIRLELSALPLVTGDKERLGQVLSNLLSNAIKYSPDSEDITVFTSTENNNIFISVRDKGIGMSENTLSRIFERFFRSSDPSVHSFPGLGLGLFIS